MAMIAVATILPLIVAHVWGGVVWVSRFTRSPGATLWFFQMVVAIFLLISFLRAWIGAIELYWDVSWAWLLIAAAISFGVARLYLVRWRREDEEKARKFTGHVARDIERARRR